MFEQLRFGSTLFKPYIYFDKNNKNNRNQMSEKEKDREVLTAPEKIELKRYGTSESLRIPRSWRKALPQLQGDLLFEARVERDGNGKVFIVFEKVRE